MFSSVIPGQGKFFPKDLLEPGCEIILVIITIILHNYDIDIYFIIYNIIIE